MSPTSADPLSAPGSRWPEPAVGASEHGGPNLLGPAPGPGRRRRRRGEAPPGTRRQLVLACGPEDLVTLDLASGALSRLRGVRPSDPTSPLPPFGLVDVALAADPERDDLAQPEAVTVRSVRLRREGFPKRKLRRALAGVEAATAGPLLGFSGSSQPYWEFRGDQPSVALVVPTQGPTLFRRDDDGAPWCRFSSARDDNWLPVDDPGAATALWTSRQAQLSGRALAQALGFPPHYLLVGLSRPRDGHCSKRLFAMLPRP